MQYSPKPLNNGYTNQYLTVDIGEETITINKLDSQERDFFIGGRGLGLYFLHKKITSKTTAYDPENPLILRNVDGAKPEFQLLILLKI